MKVPVSLKIAALAVGTTAFYTYVGQMVPQKEVHPPQEIAIAKDISADEMRRIGKELMEGKGLCLTCHTVGRKGALRFPDLEGIGANAASRRPGMTDVQYLAESIYDPGAYIVPGFNPGMPPIHKPPIGLSDDEIRCLVAFLQSLGGTTTVTMETQLVGPSAGATSAAAAAPAGAGTAAPAH